MSIAADAADDPPSPMKTALLALCLLTAVPAPAADTLAALVRLLGSSADRQLQLDVLRGLRDATRGHPQVPMPPGWEAIEPELMRSNEAEIRGLARTLGLAFGSETALAALRATLVDGSVEPAQRQEALQALVGVRDPRLPDTLRRLLQEPAMRGAAVRGLGGFDDPGTPDALLAVYPSLAGSERRDALATLASRTPYARALLAAVAGGTVPARDLTAELVRQLRSLKDDAVDRTLVQVYGAFREVSADGQAEIERYKRLYRAGGSTPGDAIRGRAVYAKVCQQCHTLFDAGGKVGPDLTGSNRGDLDYLLQNIVDPNAVLPNEYRASTVELKDGRVLTGIIRQQDDRTLTLATANETLTLARADVAEMIQSQLSMMPEGLLAPLADQEYRDLIYYLGRPGQTPLLATPETANLFFNGVDLALWHGDDPTWQVANGAIVGRLTADTAGAATLASDMIVADFRLRLKVHGRPEGARLELSLRAEPTANGGARGYRLTLGGEGRGTLREEGGRGVLGGGTAPAAARDNDGDAWEILATGGRIRAAVNGVACLDLDDPTGARQGILAFHLGPGFPAEVRLSHLELELQPKPELSTPRDPRGR